VSTIRETALVFLRLGATAFGGPAAHVAMMEAEAVGRRRWLTREQFLDYLGITNLIPGPNSTELAMILGLHRHGRLGMLVAGGCFIAPAALIVWLLAWAYVKYERLPQVEGMLYGVTPVVIAIVLRALVQLAHSAVKSVALALLLVFALIAIAFGVHELIVLAAAAVIHGLLVMRKRAVAAGAVAILTAPPGSIGAASVWLAESAAVSLWTLGAVFLKIGAVLFGSGYVLLAFLRADFVDRLGWLTEQQLIDAITVGQITPGPLFTTATFVGYIVAGSAGAIVATVAIFLPGFVFVAVSGPLIPRIRRSNFAGAALDGVNVASLALMTVVTWQLGRSALVSGLPIVVFVTSVLLLLRTRLNATWLLAAGALLGWLVSAR
jgi:chromate transporter